MSGNKRVLIFGRSLNLAGIGACLKLVNDLDVDSVDPQNACIMELLQETTPEAMIYDLNNPPIDLDMDLLRERPGLLLIGVDPSSDNVMVFKGQRRKVVTAEELTQLILNHTADTRLNLKHSADGR
jgi:hypothetical protein